MVAPVPTTFEHPAAGGDEPRRRASADAGAEDGDALGRPATASRPSISVAGAGRLGVARAGEHDARRRRRRRSVGAGADGEVAGGRRGQQLGEVGVEAGQHDLGLGVAEADVVLDAASGPSAVSMSPA